MKNLNQYLRRDNGYSDFEIAAPWIGALVLFCGALAFLTWVPIGSGAHQTSYTRICGDEKTYTRISVDRCYDSKVGAEWLYVEDGDRLPKIGGDTSNTSTRTHGHAKVRTTTR